MTDISSAVDALRMKVSGLVYLVRAAGSNADFLLNVGPMPNGRIQLRADAADPIDTVIAIDLDR